jgi:hypothetical protein
MIPDDRLKIEGAFRKLEFAVRFELGGWFVALYADTKLSYARPSAHDARE